LRLPRRRRGRSIRRSSAAVELLGKPAVAVRGRLATRSVLPFYFDESGYSGDQVQADQPVLVVAGLSPRTPRAQTCALTLDQSHHLYATADVEAAWAEVWRLATCGDFPIPSHTGPISSLARSSLRARLYLYRHRDAAEGRRTHRTVSTQNASDALDRCAGYARSPTTKPFAAAPG
jgi:hypothetical protein